MLLSGSLGQNRRQCILTCFVVPVATGKWRAATEVDGKAVHLGTYATAEEVNSSLFLGLLQYADILQYRLHPEIVLCPSPEGLHNAANSAVLPASDVSEAPQD